MDAIGAIGQPAGIVGAPAPERAEQIGTEFLDLLRRELERVDAMQRDALAVTETIAADTSNDLEALLAATHRADAAYQLLLEVRNQVLRAYDELRQIRV